MTHRDLARRDCAARRMLRKAKGSEKPARNLLLGGRQNLRHGINRAVIGQLHPIHE